MGFRTLEISKAAEIHIKEGQLEVTTIDGIALIPLEDLSQKWCIVQPRYQVFNTIYKQY